MKNVLSVLLLAVLMLSVPQASAQSWPELWKSYVKTGNPLDVVPSTGTSDSVAAWFERKVDVTNGSATGLTLTNGTVNGTDLSSGATVATGGAISRTLANRANDNVNILDYGASHTDTGSTNGTAIANAITAAQSSTQWVNFPYSSAGYTITGTFTNDALGYFNFGGNVLSGTGIGTPGSGAGTLNSLYTNPYLIVTGIKYELDPAGQAVPASGSANIGWALECKPNRPNSGDKSTTVRMVACGYIGADTGTGGASGTRFTMEDINPVLNLNTNSGTGIEQDVNFNGTVADGQVSRGLFITGGGAAGNNTLSVAMDIQHSDYSGGWLPWTTGISIRNATNQIMQYKSTDSEAGFFQEAFDAENNAIWKVDKNGYSTASGYTTAGAVTGGVITATSGMTSSPTGTVAYSAKASGADDFVATRASASDTGFLFRGFSETGTTLVSIDKNGYINTPGVTTSSQTNTATTYSALATCTSSIAGRMQTITDSSVSTWGDTITPGGSTTVLAFCNGTNWTVMAK